jgi:hypothetical protein
MNAALRKRLLAALLAGALSLGAVACSAGDDDGGDDSEEGEEDDD